MFQHILVPLDGSQRAERAIPVAARLARASGGSITLLRIIASPFEPGWQAIDSPASMQEPLDADQVGAAEYLAGISAAAVLAGVATSTSVFKGSPATGILSVARSQKVDIIIMCSHGYTAMTRWARACCPLSRSSCASTACAGRVRWIRTSRDGYRTCCQVDRSFGRSYTGNSAPGASGETNTYG